MRRPGLIDPKPPASLCAWGLAFVRPLPVNQTVMAKCRYTPPLAPVIGRAEQGAGAEHCLVALSSPLKFAALNSRELLSVDVILGYRQVKEAGNLMSKDYRLSASAAGISNL